MKVVHRDKNGVSCFTLGVGGVRRGLAQAFGMAIIALLSTAFGTPIQAQVVTGRLLDAQTDIPVVLGYVALLTEEGEMVTWTLTDENGSFRVEAKDPGSFQLYGEGMGYRSSVEGPFLLGEKQVVPAVFRLDPMPVVLDSLRVVAQSQRRSLMLSGYYEREQRGLGHYIGPEKIEDRFEARYVTDFLWEVPGVRLMPADNFAGSGYVPMMRSAATLRGYCLPDVYLDGIPQPEASELDQIITPWNIEGIEVYRGASEVPSKFTSAGSACGVILLWSRRGG